MPTRRHPRAPNLGSSKPHEMLVRRLIESDGRICRNGFARAVRALIDEIGSELDEMDLSSFLPDAYMIDHENKAIVIYEVEVTSYLSPHKLDCYAWFWFCWDSEDEHEWRPRLFVVDRYFHKNELDLCDLYLNRLVGNQRGAFA